MIGLAPGAVAVGLVAIVALVVTVRRGSIAGVGRGLRERPGLGAFVLLFVVGLFLGWRTPLGELFVRGWL